MHSQSICRSYQTNGIHFPATSHILKEYSTLRPAPFLSLTLGSAGTALISLLFSKLSFTLYAGLFLWYYEAVRHLWMTVSVRQKIPSLRHPLQIKVHHRLSIAAHSFLHTSWLSSRVFPLYTLIHSFIRLIHVHSYVWIRSRRVSIVQYLLSHPQLTSLSTYKLRHTIPFSHRASFRDIHPYVSDIFPSSSTLAIENEGIEISTMRVQRVKSNSTKTTPTSSDWPNFMLQLDNLIF